MTDNTAGRVLLQRDGRLARVTLSHPGRLNAITVGMWRELRDVFTRIAADDDVRCVIVRGEGGNFAAGADIREFPAERADAAGVQRYHREVLAPALQAVAQCPHPVVAQIEGVCVGGGLEIACQCDLRIAGESARFGVPINRLGFPMAPDEMRGLLALAGRAATLAILLEGRVFGAAEARDLGLLTRIVADADVAAQALRSAERIGQGAPLAARINKRLSARLAQGGALTEAEYQDYFSYADSRDHKEGVRAFLAGVDPHFSGD
ncbi:enoyl-CoA hydratase-related protein [Achromobacter xylosoxidans]|jgi:enoyl-CoA hydratase|uniref:enoyl-CoA hydratase/isomerase family protein n=1 Tax=Alcaligenes xylosoxydans xylosoxydans TaxID=85698 RepID=UPI0006C4EB6A|nr:enoyl-CoA hydratase-related protein [Achromobacter xylosoxidans]MCH1987347.1 enoyl-CoA hydratase-related protein [Achromobacter xylosoxidans]MCH4580328.1 enoyl-CoA hydratase-related protein [Achromobacter xylosoxidans]MCH4585395.1 enoyl-CoA hydratase-related protein [Achromobacter xylosoxidans]MCM2573765.1 enoyl-CoA hydratase-related protein [Achromobacter xylosoxidans]MDZ5618623.1 enoyl-CoA hydratase-related protein [Achromobacter xylosoxidans]